jgi:hypothetical protein
VTVDSRRRVACACVLLAALASSACARSPFGRPVFEYEEEIYLNVDGSATINVNASLASLVALRGAPLPADPLARVDLDRVREFFTGAGTRVTRVSLSRRDRRRFVHVSMDVDDIRRLPAVKPFDWSSYRLTRQDGVLEFRQVLGAAAGQDVGDVGWHGDEAVRFRVHVPSQIPFHNSPGGVERGNILTWDQPLTERAAGTPLEMEFQMEPQSILYSTLLLFGGTIAAAACAFGLAIWFFVKRGRGGGHQQKAPDAHPPRGRGLKKKI